MYKVIIFGTGKCSEQLNNLLDKEKVNIICYADNDLKKQGSSYFNKKVINPLQILKLNFDFIIIASQFGNEILVQLKNIGVNENKIFNYFEYIKGFAIIDVCKCDYIKQKTIYDKVMASIDYKMIITGLSYAEEGVIEQKLKFKTANLALASQDLYFDYYIAKLIIENSKNKIKYCLIGLSYYSFEYDLALSVFKFKCPLIYNKLLGIDHGYDKNEDEVMKKLTEEENYFAEKLFLKDYIQKYLKLVNYEGFYHNYRKNIFGKLKLEEKVMRGQNKAKIDSNKNYPKTICENKRLIYEYMSLLKNYNIKPILIIFPVTKYYYNCFDNRLKEQFYDILKDLNYKFEFQILDYFNSNFFDDIDFRDESHLNIYGAKKMTKVLNEEIYF